jgi:hypothetical protein
MKLWCFIFTTLLCTNAYSANPESVAANVTFVTPITITENDDLDFGLVSTTIVNETVTIATNGTRSSTNNALLLGSGVHHAADVTITATASHSVTIVVDNFAAATGYVLSLPFCDYNGDGSAACTSLGITSVASATVLIGMTLTGNGSDVDGADNTTFDVTMTYN